MIEHLENLRRTLERLKQAEPENSQVIDCVDHCLNHLELANSEMKRLEGVEG